MAERFQPFLPKGFRSSSGPIIQSLFDIIDEEIFDIKNCFDGLIPNCSRWH